LHFVYIDESGDDDLIVYSALAVRDTEWKAAKNALIAMRKTMFDEWGIEMRKELHAWKFVSGRGRFLGGRDIKRGVRADLFRRVLRYGAHNLGGVRLFNAVFPLGRSYDAFEYLVNRINRTAQRWNSHIVLVVDEGKEVPITRMVRKMGVYNMIPSRLGLWAPGEPARNITTDWILEDPVFRDSASSYFIQFVDFCAFALLRREAPTAKLKFYGVHRAFAELAPILERSATRYDVEGIIRPR
jgi:hypothetical protein